DGVRWSTYQAAAATLVEFVVSDSQRLDAVFGPGPRDESGASRFIEEFGLRAHRRPLSSSERSAYLEVYRDGVALDSANPFESGISLVLEAFLQSPYFLYRLELAGEEVNGRLELDAYALASRLSYLLWNTMPDDTLLERAGGGLGGDALLTEFDRLAADPRTQSNLQRFYSTVFYDDGLSSIRPADDFYGSGPELLQSARAERARFWEHAIENDFGLAELLTSTVAFADSTLAEIYALEGDFGSELQQVELDSTQRRGIFMQAGFLAAQATPRNPDPIHRGAFLSQRIACNRLILPNDDLPPVPADATGTNRQIIEAHTEATGTNCVSCHRFYINAFGFPLENFDAVGRYRELDGDAPVD
ncbi:MAG: DUF1588 domain-containing protein, partial [Myxococcota bacterium]